jgi:hypothetical protein
MSNDEITEIAKEAGWPDSLIAPIIMAKLADVVRLVEEKVTEKANARANASWTLMCKKMVAIEREACAKVCESQNEAGPDNEHWWECADAIRARGEQS